MNLAIIGPSGAGKGSHAAALCARYELQHVSTGDLFRHHLQTHSALGILASRYMEQGELVPDEIVDAMIEEWAGKLPPAKGALFDGFPRTGDQVRFLDDLLGRLNRSIDAVVYLRISDEEIVRRLSGRLICRNCQTPYHTLVQRPKNAGICDRCGGALYQRTDDAPEMMRTRLRVFHRTTGPVLAHYAAANKLILLPGEGPSGEVEARMIGALDAVKNRVGRFATREEAVAIAAPPGAPLRPVPSARRTLDLVLLGGPGSGKGTQAERLCAS